MDWNLLVLAGGLAAGYRLLTVKEGEGNVLASAFLLAIAFCGIGRGVWLIVRAFP